MKWYLDFVHSGTDPGAMGPKNTRESDCALKIGMIVKNTLETASEKVVTARESDKYYSLTERTTKASSNNCDYFISIHLNSATNSTAKGCEVWVYDENSKLYTLSKNLCTNLSKSLNTPNRSVKVSKQFSVLKNSKMPALLIEVDFISNPQLEASLSSNDYINNIAKTISSTLLSFVNLCEKAEINEATLSRYENGLREPKAATLSKLAEILEVSTDYLLGITDIRNYKTLQDDMNKDVESIYENTKEMLKQDGLMLYGKPVSKDDVDNILKAMKVGMMMALQNDND
ncbi:MAG: N-acetylmuramoyl-L-alanine amidase [Peptostreptococcaceae bacterium]